MGLAVDLIKFFSASNAKKENGKILPYSVGEFLSQKNQWQSKTLDVIEAIKILENNSLLIPSGSNQTPLFGQCYYNLGYHESLATYGSYDFLVDGFLSIRNHFINAVRPVIVKTTDGNPDIGTCCIVDSNNIEDSNIRGSNIIVTAFHCIDNMENVFISDINDNPIKVKNIFTTKDKKNDIAIIETEGEPFNSVPKFEIADVSILEEILTMGYPPIPGFDAIQIAELASVNSKIKTSLGRIVGNDKSYLDGQEYLLINARVKGGNSGGPIISNLGMLAGIIVQIPTDTISNSKLDVLGYGIASPHNELWKIFDSIKGENSNLELIPFKNNVDGFTTSF